MQILYMHVRMQFMGTLELSDDKMASNFCSKVPRETSVGLVVSSIMNVTTIHVNNLLNIMYKC